MKLGTKEFYLIFGILVVDLISTWILWQMYKRDLQAQP